jgi:nucleoside-diphosphate-sugar epimerase
MTSATANVIAAAKAAGAAILFPGNVYGLGRTTGRPVDESAPMRPCSRKGLLRVELENALRVAAAEGARVLIVRAGDFFGPSVRNGMVDPLFGLAAKGKAMQTFGRLEVPHQWAYMPDLARAAVDLMAGARAAFEVVHYAGIVADPARAMCEAIARAAGQPDLKARVMPWWLLRLAGIFDPVARELIELGYLWDESLILDGGKLRHLLPAHRDTPLPEAVAATLADYRLKP